MTQFDVINRTFVFIHNIPSNFIEEIWKDSPYMAERYASANAILKFFASLDESNTEKFCTYASTWIQQHN